MAQGGVYRGFAVAFAFLPLALFGWGSAGAMVGFCGLGGGWDSSEMGFTGVNTTWGIDG